MKQFMNFSCCFFLLCSSALSAQKEDNVWMLGGLFSPNDTAYRTCSIDFFNETLNIKFLDENLRYTIGNTIICDSSGNLSSFANGKHWYNRGFEIMDGGANFYPNADYSAGVPSCQSYGLLLHPKGGNQIIYFYGAFKVYPAPVPGGNTLGYIKFYYAIADMSLNGGLGKVITRDVLVTTNTLLPTQINAVRHGNGRDWWLLAPGHLGQRFHRFLLDPTGIHAAGIQHIAATDLGLGHTCFSPDGH